MSIGLFFCRGHGPGGGTLDVDALAQEFAEDGQVSVHEHVCLTEAQREL
ncbi:MAG: hypothetical protein GW802_31040, partial [Armatimonadetes bacterium]|nr:hypothetical protein [Armatimonadota bacterium]